VGIADCVRGGRDEVRIPVLPDVACGRIAEILGKNRLAGLVNVRNPLDLTPMAGEAAYAGAAEVMLECDEVDALLVSAVPLTPALATTERELSARESLPDVLGRLSERFDKPIVAVLDSGSMYEPLVRRLRERHIPVFRSADQAVRVLGKYLSHRVRIGGMEHTVPRPLVAVG
jgi:acyl-CoA synthetase (NDP forming)